MALDVTATAEIDAPPGAVAAIQFDPARDPEWIGGVDRVEFVTEAPLTGGSLRVGSQVLRVGAFLGRRIEWLMQIEALEPGHRVAMHALRSPFKMDVDYQLEPLDGGRRTRARIRVRGEPRGLYGLPGPLLGPLVRRSVQGDLTRLKRLVESGGRGN